ncbi:TetR/AcrR family transcriptional regulator [Desulfovibrio sp. ZJ200]|uniref:TetR/AcrR family transcriptional regulator n=1 Tax=Desulfovibrio sp. ZJ200 TaxID=2709792 RepID=UPI0013EBF47C|nr:TetR/AcrR family transcriptional regulator [Desulfovibrio sp. ZJ200]
MSTKEPPESTPRPSPQCRQEKDEARRIRILDAALEEFSNKGFAAARVEDIAQRARVSKGAIYLYFSDKKALFQGVLEAAFVPFLRRNEHILRDASLDLRQKLLRMYAPLTGADACSPLRRSVCLAFSEGLHDPELMEGFYQAFLAPYRARLQEELLPAAQAPNVRDALARFPELLVGPLLFGVIHTELVRSQPPLDLEGLFAAYLQILFPQPPSG